MISRDEEIRQLYIERLAGLFSEADERRYLDLLKKDSHAREIVNHLEEENRKYNVSDFIAGIEEEKELHELKKRLPDPKPIKTKLVTWPRWVAAAVLLLIGSFAIVIFNDKGKDSITVPGMVKQDQNKKTGIHLTLSDGKSVDLPGDSSSSTIRIGDLKMVTKKGSLESVSGNASDKINVLTVPPTEEYHIVLDDGTKVWVNSASKLYFPFRFTGKTREITVVGEAYFEVTKDVNRPFIVNAGSTRIEVLGTHFNVNAYKGLSVKTSLVEGKVRLSSDGVKTVQLTEGYEAAYVSGKGFVMGQFDPENAISWIKGTYYFHDLTLSEIAVVISNWFDVRVVFDNPDLMKYEISGLLEKGQLHHFINDLETSAQISCSFKGKELHLNKK